MDAHLTEVSKGKLREAESTRVVPRAGRRLIAGMAVMQSVCSIVTKF